MSEREFLVEYARLREKEESLFAVMCIIVALTVVNAMLNATLQFFGLELTLSAMVAAGLLLVYGVVFLMYVWTRRKVSWMENHKEEVVTERNVPSMETSEEIIEVQPIEARRG